MPRRKRHLANGAKNNSSGKAAVRSAPLLVSNRRKWLFRFAAVTLVPLFLLGGLELALRLAGYGYPTDFFLKTRVNGRTVYIENQKFGFRFFPPELARSPSPVVMEASKPSNVYRIFLLGESAALGDPDPAYGCGRYLEVLLGERYPATQFEVVCVAMTAINSHAILPIARECARHEGDLWVIYAGNNEMVGPFGSVTVFGPQAPSLGLIRASLTAKKLRIGQLLDALLGRLPANPSTTQSWRGMGMFSGRQTRHDNAGHLRVYDYFRKNLTEIVRVGSQAGVKVVLSTVACNLKDCPPFASLHSANLSEIQTNSWDRLYQEGRVLESSGRLSEAVEKYSQASQLDHEYAELQFRLGSCYLALTNPAQAQKCFELARDLDALPFRATTHINTIIEKVADEYAQRGVHRLDAVGVLSPDRAPGIPGQESFYEHVHLNFDGTYLLARALAEQVTTLLPPGIAKDSKREWASSEICARRLALTDWNRHRVCETVLQRVTEAPFANQSNAAHRQQLYRDKLVELKSGMSAAALKQARATYHEALSRAPNDFFLHRKFAELLEAAGDLAGALTEWQRVRELLPHHPVAYFQLGRLLVRQDRNREAEEHFKRAVTLRGEFVEALDELGQVLAKQRKFEESLALYARALQLRPDDATIHFHMANALAAHDKRAEALLHLHEAIRLHPRFWEARYLLGVEFALQDKTDEAREQFAEVVRLRPEYALGHLNLGVAFARQGRMKESLAEFETTLRLDPNNKPARQHMEKLQQLRSQQR